MIHLGYLDAKLVGPLRWINTFNGLIGFVMLTGEDSEGEYYKVYAGIVRGANLEEDVRYIGTYGSPIQDEALAKVLAGGLEGQRTYRLS